jgi:thiosulfate dehydrogenase
MRVDKGGRGANTVSGPVNATVIGFVLTLAGAGCGLCAWGEQPNWYAVRDVGRLPNSQRNDLIIYGYQHIANTQRHFGPDAAEPTMRFAGNNLACGNCHLRAGLQPFAAPFVSTYTTSPMMMDDRVISLSERINGCMTRSMNGRALPAEGREMKALLAYIKFFGEGDPNRHADPRDGLAADLRIPTAARPRLRQTRLCCANQPPTRFGRKTWQKY